MADRLVVPLKPGNAGGGKGPDFGRAVEVTKSRGLTGRSSNPTFTVPRSRKELYGPAKGAPSDAAVGRFVKPVGEPDAANPHVRFDEREVETG